MDRLWSLYHAEIPDFLRDFAATLPIERLKQVGMNCGCEYTHFPRFAEIGPYSRYDHSLGVALIIWHFTGSREQALAGLFHDVTTPVFAHVVDFLNGDHLRQESTEAGVAECLAASPEVAALLEQYQIALGDISDYHRYPIADNDAPALSADRLEYTLGNLLNYGFADLKSIEAMYRDLTVGQDERGRPELVFRTPEQAAAFARGALRNSRVYVADEDRFSMQFLADLLGLALERGAVTRRDLWTTESAVIGKLERDMVCGPLWRRFCGYSRIFRSQERPEAGEWVRVNAKKRYIDPLVSGMGRVSHLDGTFRRELKEFKMLDFSCWLCAETEKSGDCLKAFAVISSFTETMAALAAWNADKEKARTDMNEQWIKTYRSEIGSFQETISAFRKGEIEKKDYKGISGGMGSYAQRDPSVHMLRLRMPGGRLTVERLGFLADTVAKYGVERMKLTTCETVQLHDLSAEQVTPIMEGAIDVGIYCRGGGGDNPRNVMSSPLSGVQQGEAFDVQPYAEAATEYLLSICRDIKMPRKLKIAFCNGVDDCVHSAFRDMGFLAKENGTFDLSIAGGLGNNHRMGVPVAEGIAPQEVLYYIRAMIDTFCAHGNYENRAKARTRYLQETLGSDGLKEAFLTNAEKRKAGGGLDLTVEPVTVNKAGDGELADARAIPQKQAGLYAVEYHPIGGILPAEKPARLYTLLKDMPGAECRVAPNETLYIINLTAAEAEKVLAATEDGARTAFEHSVACIGASICQQGVRDSQSLLRAAVQAVREAGLPDGALPKIVISGCPSSCAAHQAGAIGFQGCVKPVDGKPQPAFRLFLGGDDTLGGARFGEPVATILEKDIPVLLVELGRAAAEQGWERWSAEHASERDIIIARFA